MAVGVQGDPVTASSVDGVNCCRQCNDDDLSTAGRLSTAPTATWRVDLGGNYILQNTPSTGINAASGITIPDPGQHQRCELHHGGDKSGNTTNGQYDGQLLGHGSLCPGQCDGAAPVMPRSRMPGLSCA